MPVKRERDSSVRNNSMITTGSSYVLAGVREQFAACSPSVCTLFANVFVKHSCPKRLYTKLWRAAAVSRESFRSDRFFTSYFRTLMSERISKASLVCGNFTRRCAENIFPRFEKNSHASQRRLKCARENRTKCIVFRKYLRRCVVPYIREMYHFAIRRTCSPTSRRWILSPFTDEVTWKEKFIKYPKYISHCICFKNANSRTYLKNWTVTRMRVLWGKNTRNVQNGVVTFHPPFNSNRS